MVSPITFDSSSFMIGTDGVAKYSDISRLIDARPTDDFKYHIAVMGEKGSGKTSLIQYL